jgi:DNA-binding XRE family transcriptional regulator
MRPAHLPPPPWAPASGPAVLAAVREAYGLPADYRFSAAGTPEAEASVAWALWEHLEDPSLPRPRLPGDPPPAPGAAALAQPGTAGQAARAAAAQLGRQVRAWREAKGLTQRQLAARLGWDQPHVARLEGGGVYPTLPTMLLLAECLGVQVVVRATPQGGRVELLPEPAAA